MPNKQKTYTGLKKASLYSCPPYERGLCGPKLCRSENLSLMRNFIRNPAPAYEEEEMIRKILQRFPVVCGYYQKLAKISGIGDIFDATVVGNYWVGGRLLDKVTKKNSNGILPFHAYHVLFVGSSTGNVKFDLKARDLCRITLARVVKTQLAIKKVLVKYRPLAEVNGKIVLADEICEEVDWGTERPELTPGSPVSLHWGKIIEILTNSEAFTLKQYTSIAIDMYNSRAAE